MLVTEDGDGVTAVDEGGEGSRGITPSERWMCRWRGACCEGGGENKEIEAEGGYLTGQERRGQEGVKRSNKRSV